MCCTEEDYVTSLAVIASLTRGAANILKVVILSTTQGTDCETDAHCGDIIFPLIFDNRVINCIAFIIGCCPVLISSAVRS